jgi:hypothetical protein
LGLILFLIIVTLIFGVSGLIALLKIVAIGVSLVILFIFIKRLFAEIMIVLANIFEFMTNTTLYIFSLLLKGVNYIKAVGKEEIIEVKSTEPLAMWLERLYIHFLNLIKSENEKIKVTYNQVKAFAIKDPIVFFLWIFWFSVTFGVILTQITKLF